MWKFLAPRCKPRDNAIHPTAWVFCGFGFGFFIQTYFHELALASFSSLTSKNSNFGINVPVFVLLIFVKKKKNSPVSLNIFLHVCQPKATGL